MLFISCQAEVLPDGDCPSFNAVNKHYYRDKNQVYYKNAMIKKADAKTFELVPMIGMSTPHPYSEMAKDNVSVFHKERVIRGADPKTFVDLAAGFGKDNRSVFFEAQTLRDADPQTFTTFVDNRDYMFARGVRMRYRDAYYAPENVQYYLWL